MAFARKPERMGDILGTVLADRGILAACREAEVIKRWPDIVGERIAAVSECTHADQGTLFVRVSSASWRQELGFYEKEFLSKISEVMNISTIKRIRIL